MRSILILCALAATALAKPKAKPPTDDDAAKAMTSLHAAVDARKTDAVLALLQTPLRYELFFDNDACSGFDDHGTVKTKKMLRSFAQCLVAHPELFANHLLGSVDRPGAEPSTFDGEAGLQIWIARTGTRGITRIVAVDGNVPGGRP
ncbi:MAG TPA: hypothetical protein VL463_18400 [Kofleriaceae bacterium]|nr:hypothetical protein [Kofleriaceae bacterium]